VNLGGNSGCAIDVAPLPVIAFDILPCRNIYTSIDPLLGALWHSRRLFYGMVLHLLSSRPNWLPAQEDRGADGLRLQIYLMGLHRLSILRPSFPGHFQFYSLRLQSLSRRCPLHTPWEGPRFFRDPREQLRGLLGFRFLHTVLDHAAARAALEGSWGRSWL